MKYNLFLIIIFASVSIFAVEHLLTQSYATTSEGTYTVESNVVNNINYTGNGVKFYVDETGEIFFFDYLKHVEFSPEQFRSKFSAQTKDLG